MCNLQIDDNTTYEFDTVESVHKKINEIITYLPSIIQHFLPNKERTRFLATKIIGKLLPNRTVWLNVESIMAYAHCC